MRGAPFARYSRGEAAQTAGKIARPASETAPQSRHARPLTRPTPGRPAAPRSRAQHPWRPFPPRGRDPVVAAPLSIGAGHAARLLRRDVPEPCSKIGGRSSRSVSSDRICRVALGIRFNNRIRKVPLASEQLSPYDQFPVEKMVPRYDICPVPIPICFGVWAWDARANRHCRRSEY
eukprot:COSAG02_NODE_960_length_15642_cov_34.870424_7_plen_176_part_00